MLTSLQLRDVGPAPSLDIEFSDRLNIFTGDNGLGKSFLLDIAFWALTGSWPGDRMAMPNPGGGNGVDLLIQQTGPHRKKKEPNEKPTIVYHTLGKTGPTASPKTG